MSQQSDSTTLGYINAITGLVKVLSWPLLLLYIFLAIRGPLIESFSQLPFLLSRSTAVSVGGFSVALRERIKSGAPADVHVVLEQISPEGLFAMLEWGNGGSTSETIEQIRQSKRPGSLYELEKLGLMRLEKNNSGRGETLCTLTDLGRTTSRYITDTMLGLLAGTEDPHKPRAAAK